MKNKIKEFLIVFLKGIFMGAADIIPGVSGGTIALITGIYERFIFSIYRFLESIISVLEFTIKRNKGYLKNIIKLDDFLFLVILGLGIATSFLAMSKFILKLISTYPTYVYSFFFGLILASAISIFKSLKDKKSDVLYGVLGFVLAFLLTGISSVETSHSLPVILITGIVAACAMLLPGISGSFMVLVLGQYEFMIKSLSSFNTKVVGTFLVGMSIGAFFMSKIISQLLKKHENKTLSLLIGLMFGALRLPLRKILLSSISLFDPFKIGFSIMFSLVGILTILLLEKMK